VEVEEELVEVEVVVLELLLDNAPG